MINRYIFINTIKFTNFLTRWTVSVIRTIKKHVLALKRVNSVLKLFNVNYNKIYLRILIQYKQNVLLKYSFFTELSTEI